MKELLKSLVNKSIMWRHQIYVISVVIRYIARRSKYHDSQAPNRHSCHQEKDNPIDNLAYICWLKCMMLSMTRQSPKRRMVCHAEEEKAPSIEQDQKQDQTWFYCLSASPWLSALILHLVIADICTIEQATLLFLSIVIIDFLGIVTELLAVMLLFE